MEILKIIVFVLSCACYAATVFFTLEAYRRLRRQEKSMKELQAELDMIAKMKQAMKERIEQEDFKEATRLKELIERQEKQAMQLMKEFNDAFGGTFEISAFKIPL